MPDVISLLNAPDPAQPHGAAAPLPPKWQAILADWPGAPQDFFATCGTADAAIRQTRVAAPGLILGDAAERSELQPGTLASLQERVAALAGQDRPHRLVLSGAIDWDGTLAVDDVAGVTLDFSAARLIVVQDTAPLIRITRSHRVTIRGLLIGQRNHSVLDIGASQDLAVTDSALAGSTEAALRLSGGASRVLVDRCAFLRSLGPAVLGLGEVEGLVIARSTFDGPTRGSFVELRGGLTARGFVADPEPARDALTPMLPSQIRILENRFGPSDAPAVVASGIRGLWVERNDFAASSQGAMDVTGPSVGMMVADNRILAAADGQTALIRVADVALTCIFRNVIEPAAQPSILATGAFGGLVVAANSLLYAMADARSSAVDAVILDPVNPGFLCTTVMMNTIRGPIGSGVLMTGTLPRLFLFDNHLFGMADYSLKSRVVQPMATSLNNWSPVRSLNLPLSDQLIEPARMVRDETGLA